MLDINVFHNVNTDSSQPQRKCVISDLLNSHEQRSVATVPLKMEKKKNILQNIEQNQLVNTFYPIKAGGARGPTFKL